MNKPLKWLLFLMTIVLIGCSPSEEAIQNALSKTKSVWTKEPSQTPYATLTPFSTYTPFPTYTAQPPRIVEITVIVTPTDTPGPSSTPTNTSTPTQTPTPFNIARCVDLILYVNSSTTVEQFQAQLDKFHGKCVRLVYNPRFIDISSPFSTSDDEYGLRDLTAMMDGDTPTDVKIVNEYSYVWGIYLAEGKSLESEKSHVLLLRRVEIIPKNQNPIYDEGLYSVGENGDIAPGVWKSMRSATATDSCYWARINPLTGNIKENHFGIAGMSVRVYEGEIFETNEECTSWYYKGQ